MYCTTYDIIYFPNGYKLFRIKYLLIIIFAKSNFYRNKMEKEQLKKQVKEQIVKFLNLNNVKPEEIKDDEPLFGEGLGLDSIDSIELIVMLSREYGINIQDPKEGRKILTTINTMVDYIEQYRTK